MNKSILVTAVIALSTGAASFAAGISYGERAQQRTVDRQYEDPWRMRPVIVRADRLINPLLDCEMASPSRLSAHVAIRSTLQQKVRSAIQGGRASHVSIYFRALNDGPWLGIDEQQIYSPASMMNVPLMMAVFRKAKDDPALLQKKLLYDRVIGGTVITSVKDTQIVVGESYTVQELVERMIRHSDNEAASILLREVTSEFAQRVWSELGISSADEQKDGDLASARQYASVFRLLYNATYLDREMSHGALELLTQTTWAGGIAAGLPKHIMVAHKFGERIPADSPLRQMHDCGIVYHDSSPYVLCVMTRGDDIASLGSVISEISAEVFRVMSRPAR